MHYPQIEAAASFQVSSWFLRSLTRPLCVLVPVCCLSMRAPCAYCLFFCSFLFVFLVVGWFGQLVDWLSPLVGFPPLSFCTEVDASLEFPIVLRFKNQQRIPDLFCILLGPCQWKHELEQSCWGWQA